MLPRVVFPCQSRSDDWIVRPVSARVSPFRGEIRGRSSNWWDAGDDALLALSAGHVSYEFGEVVKLGCRRCRSGQDAQAEYQVGRPARRSEWFEERFDAVDNGVGAETEKRWGRAAGTAD